MEEKRAIEKFIESIDREIELRSKDEVEESWSENKYNFMKKYGHL